MEAFRDWIFGALRRATTPRRCRPTRRARPTSAIATRRSGRRRCRARPAIYVGYNEVQPTERRTLDRRPRGIDRRRRPTRIRPARSSSTCATTAAATTTPRPLRTALETIAHDRPGRVSLITGRSTFSAAGNFVTDLKVGPEEAGIRLVGEAPGGGLDMYGDVRVVTLPGEPDRRPRVVALPRACPGRRPARHRARRPGRGRLGRLRRRSRPGPRGRRRALTRARPTRPRSYLPRGGGRCGSSSPEAAARAARGSCATCASTVTTSSTSTPATTAARPAGASSRS